MSLLDIQLHLSRSFSWHVGLGYGTRSSPQMKTSNMNLTLLTTNSNFGDEAMGCGGEGWLLLPALLAYLQTLSRVTNTCNFTDPKLVGYKLMRGSRNFFQGGGGSMPDGQKWTTYFFLSSTYFTVYRWGPMVWLQRKLYFSKDPEGV